MIDPKQRALGDTAWLDLANPAARDYYGCVGTELIDRGFTLIGFPEHDNVIAHASSKPEAIRNFVFSLEPLRHYGDSKGETIYFSGDPATDDTAKQINFLHVPSRFFHTSFAQRYQNKIVRKGIGVGYSYSLSPLRVQEVLATAPHNAKVFFYGDNWDATQDDLRRFMELDGDNGRYLTTTGAQTAQKYGTYFIPNLLH